MGIKTRKNYILLAQSKFSILNVFISGLGVKFKFRTNKPYSVRPYFYLYWGKVRDVL